LESLIKVEGRKRNTAKMVGVGALIGGAFGGGGGLQHPLYKGEEEKIKDLYDSVSTKRMSHFLEVDNFTDTLKLNVMMLNEKFTSFGNVYSLTIKK
jgi:hypothetical protein